MTVTDLSTRSGGLSEGGLGGAACSEPPPTDAERGGAHADTAISVRNLSKHYFIYRRPEDRLKQSIVPRLQRLIGRAPAKYYQDFAALNGVSFDVRRGETVGIIGRNGCGKSTLLQIICGTLQPSEGEVVVNGRIAALLELGAGFNPEFTGRENVLMKAAILGLSPKEIAARFDEIAAFADIGPFIEQPVKTYSSGMYVRLAFAVAINVDPDILVIDESLAVGDVAFQRKCFARLEQIRERGATILFVSHSTGAIVELCDRAILLDAGEALLDGKPKRVVNQYLKLMNMPPDKVADAREKIRALQGAPEPEEEGAKSGKATEDVRPEEKNGADGAASPPVPTMKTPEEETPEERERRLEEEEGWFDPHLKSESMVEYESRGARIRDLRIIAPSGRQVNVLKMGQRYIYEYWIDYMEDSEKVGCGCLIKTIHGVELGGTGSIKWKNWLLFVPSGSSIRTRIPFNCILAPGVYFMNAGTSRFVNGERVMAHRMLDGLMFRVADSDELRHSGIIDFSMEMEIKMFEGAENVRGHKGEIAG